MPPRTISHEPAAERAPSPPHTFVAIDFETADYGRDSACTLPSHAPRRLRQVVCFIIYVLWLTKTKSAKTYLAWARADYTDKTKANASTPGTWQYPAPEQMGWHSHTLHRTASQIFKKQPKQSHMCKTQHFIDRL